MQSNLKSQLITRCRVCIILVITGLFLSGVTAFPIETELALLIKNTSVGSGILSAWLIKVYQAVKCTNQAYPYLSYGTDWLAFAHIILAVLFIGPYKNPVKNVWVVEFGIISAIAIFPLAFIAGGIRGIPIFWRLIDCSFGITALIPLMICYQAIKKIKKLKWNTL
jgi:hypothetical protein